MSIERTRKTMLTFILDKADNGNKSIQGKSDWLSMKRVDKVECLSNTTVFRN